MLTARKQLVAAREVARLAGRTRYVGTVCKKHPAAGGERLVRSTNCVECEREAGRESSRRHRASRPEHARAVHRASYARHREERLSATREWYEENRDQVLARRRSPEVREIEARRYREWSRANRSILTERQRLRVAQTKAHQLTDDQRSAIQAFYDEARRLTAETGVEHQVDHVVPLRGKTVCGLHVPWNLRVVTKALNLAKRDSMPPPEEQVDWAAEGLTLLRRM